ncbi:Uma2 family endonuclease [Streptomyces sp. NRRL F-4428]|uniref:Uma2 family endonuclease n=1 Tax=Streptomyces sp. NRRL F-4428 TaxID=1609137 RepID=UPI0005ECC90A|nr:Uma2 family endonuclease [Streptomyces sp. NRRL F-4428]KJK47186.1 restriction endonuclease [Streptomyces sp. NRRL F-4428]
MSALTVQQEPQGGDSWEGLVRLWEETDWPEGCRVEIIEGIITVAPPPVNHHNYIAVKVQRALMSVLPEDCEIYQTLNVAVPSRSGLFIPDLVVAPDDVVLEDANYVAGTAAELVVEITSKSNAANDRVAKLHGYAAAGIPFYLLIDPHATGEPAIHLYSEPANGTYRLLWSGKFGETVKLPEPFGVAIDTSAFPRP